MLSCIILWLPCIYFLLSIFSWHLWSVLSSLGYSHTHPSFLASLHCNYSAQLESMGAWQWAVFVAQHIEDPVLRYRTVEGVVSRHCTSEEKLNEQEQFVIDELSVSRCVVYKAKVGSSIVILFVTQTPFLIFSGPACSI